MSETETQESVSQTRGGGWEGPVLALTIWVLMAVGTALFFKREWWLPALASDRVGIDRLFLVLLIVTGIVFVGVQAILGSFLWRYREGRVIRASHWHESGPLEVGWTLGTALVLALVIVAGLQLWGGIFSPAPADALVVEVTGQQFEWTIRYSGKDGIFGRTDPALLSPDNRLGLDPRDPASRDDLILINQLYLPVDRAVRVRLRAKDVIHSFFLPNFRVKQDAIPGMTVETWFRPTREGDYEIACAELCGLGHYRMRGLLHVLSQEDFARWLSEQVPEELDGGIPTAGAGSGSPPGV